MSEETSEFAEDLTERALRWAGTMAGHPNQDYRDQVHRNRDRRDQGTPGQGDRDERWAEGQWTIRLAHADSDARVGEVSALDRSQREDFEDASLAPGATRASGAGNRMAEEEPDPQRTCFERDRDRILHATAFRRLAGKTQVFVFPEDHQRTRLTHALEVAQVAVGIARAARLNESLTEAIALGHDCGHGPGGHASEDALTPFVEGGYDHAVWGADVVLAPLNLCSETLDGIRNHSWSRPAPSTPEGEVVSWADRIAYVCHDFEDAVRAGIVTPGALPKPVSQRCGDSRGEQLGTFISGVVDTIRATGRIGLEEELATALAEFRECNYQRIYLRPASTAQAKAVIQVLQALVEYYADRPHLIPGCCDGDASSEQDVHAAVVYVAGMTDRYAFRSALARLHWDPSKLPQGIDTGIAAARIATS